MLGSNVLQGENARANQFRTDMYRTRLHRVRSLQSFARYHASPAETTGSHPKDMTRLLARIKHRKMRASALGTAKPARFVYLRL